MSDIVIRIRLNPTVELIDELAAGTTDRPRGEDLPDLFDDDWEDRPQARGKHSDLIERHKLWGLDCKRLELDP